MDDTEPKFGLAVTGVVHPDRVLTNAAARAGDALVLTKPIGTGILATAVKRGLADEDVARRIVAVMRRLNRAAAEAMVETGAHACTDVTGFGLLGHLREMAAASGVDAEIEAGAVPGPRAGPGPRRGRRRARAARSRTSSTSRRSSTGRPASSRVDRLLLADAQTSGGLLIAVAAGRCGGAPRGAPGAGGGGEPAGRGASLPGARAGSALSGDGLSRGGDGRRREVDRPRSFRVQSASIPRMRRKLVVAALLLAGVAVVTLEESLVHTDDGCVVETHCNACLLRLATTGVVPATFALPPVPAVDRVAPAPLPSHEDATPRDVPSRGPPLA